MNIIDEIKSSFRHGSVLTRLIYVNLAVFIFIQFSLIVLHLMGNAGYIEVMVRWLAIPADPLVLIRKPWTLISYMFTHQGFLHILFNLLWLFWFGKIFLSYLSGKQLLSVYILGGIAGGLLYVASYNLFPGLIVDRQTSVAIGASASVMAVVVAIASLVPDYRIYVMLVGPVRIIWVALISFVLSSLLDFSVNTGGKIAHIGGALFGYIFTLRVQKGRDFTMGFALLIDKLKYLFRPRRRKMRVSHKMPANDYEYNKHKKERQKEVDRILDKISKSGYESLTASEKELLFTFGKKN